MSCTCQYYELPCFQEDDFFKQITVHDDDDVPINLTGGAVSFYARLTQDASTDLFELHVGAGITITSGSAGIFTISSTAAAMNLDDVVFDRDEDDRVSIPYWIVITPLGGVRETIMAGPLVIHRS